MPKTKPIYNRNTRQVHLNLREEVIVAAQKQAEDKMVPMSCILRELIDLGIAAKAGNADD